MFFVARKNPVGNHNTLVKDAVCLHSATLGYGRIGVQLAVEWELKVTRKKAN
jgi:hypothetical protein